MSFELIGKKYINITHLIQNEFERNVEKYGEKMKCRKGCSQCCSQIFRITELDAYVIKKYLTEIPSEEKNYLRNKAQHYLELFSDDKLKSDEFFSNPKLPCPALTEEGACMIYEARPVICRRFGPPVFDYKNPGKLFACELNFENGEEIIDDELIPNQTLIGKEWDELKTTFNKDNNLNKDASTTIAEAIMYQYDS